MAHSASAPGSFGRDAGRYGAAYWAATGQPKRPVAASSIGAPEGLQAPLDEELVSRIVSGDSAAFELLMRRYNQRLFRIARSVTRDEHEAEDIVQETYLRAYTHLLRLRGRAHVATWLTRVAFHESLRRKRRRLRRDEEASRRCDPSARARGDAEPLVALAERREVLSRTIDALPDAIRTIVVLRLVEGLTTRETATCLKMSEANIKVSLHRGRRLLAEKIQDATDGELGGQFAFGSDRCDRVVATVLRSLGRVPAAPGFARPVQTRPTGEPQEEHGAR